MQYSLQSRDPISNYFLRHVLSISYRDVLAPFYITFFIHPGTYFWVPFQVIWAPQHHMYFRMHYNKKWMRNSSSALWIFIHLEDDWAHWWQHQVWWSFTSSSFLQWLLRLRLAAQASHSNLAKWVTVCLASLHKRQVKMDTLHQVYRKVNL